MAPFAASRNTLKSEGSFAPTIASIALMSLAMGFEAP